MACTIILVLTSFLGLFTAFWAVGFLARLALFPSSSGADRWIISCLLSIFTVAAVCGVCGLGGFLTLKAVSSVYLLTALALAAAAAMRKPPPGSPEKTRLSPAGLAAACILGLVAARAAAFPLTAWDTLMRYAYLGKLFAKTGLLCYPPASPDGWLMLSEPEAYPPLVPLLFSWTFLFSREDYAARLISPLFLALTCVAIAATARRIAGGDRGAAGAPLLFLSFPAVILHTLLHNGYADVPLLFFSVCCLYFTITLEGRRRRVLLLGCTLGCAMLTKYSALLLLPAVLITGILEGRWKKTSLALLLGIGIALPWYLRTYLLTGNPFHPLFFTLFGDRTGSVNGLIYFDSFTRFEAPAASVLREATLWTFGWNGSAIVSCIALVQLIKRRLDRTDIVLLVWLGTTLAASVLMRRQEIRFGLLSPVILSLLAARYLSGRHALRATVLTVVTVLILLQGSGAPLGKIFSANYSEGATLDQEKKKQAALGEDYAAWQFINSLPGEALILTPDNRFYYLERRALALKNPLIRPLLGEEDGAKAKKMLQERGITHIMVYDPARSPIGGILAGRSPFLRSLAGGQGQALLSGERFRLLRLDPGMGF